MPGAGGVRKLRWSGIGRGKRGGTRVIYYYQDANWPIEMLAWYGKNQKDNLSAAEKRTIKQLVKAINAERRRKRRTI